MTKKTKIKRHFRPKASKSLVRPGAHYKRNPQKKKRNKLNPDSKVATDAALIGMAIDGIMALAAVILRSFTSQPRPANPQAKQINDSKTIDLPETADGEFGCSSQTDSAT